MSAILGGPTYALCLKEAYPVSLARLIVLDTIRKRLSDSTLAWFDFPHRLSMRMFGFLIFQPAKIPFSIHRSATSPSILIHVSLLLPLQLLKLLLPSR